MKLNVMAQIISGINNVNLLISKPNDSNRLIYCSVIIPLKFNDCYYLGTTNFNSKPFSKAAVLILDRMGLK